MTTETKFLTELDNEMAYYKNKPIREATSMKRPLVTIPMDAEWKERITKHFWSTGFTGVLEETFSKEMLPHIKGTLALRDRLLTFGGEEGCMPVIEEDLEKIQTRGQLWYGDKITLMKGEPSRCHSNAADLWDSNRDHESIQVCIATGYALSSDGLWRQHSWLVYLSDGKRKIIETTEKRLAYFGFVLTEQEAEIFYDDNY